MATVTHGLKDGVDEILEKANSLDRRVALLSDSESSPARIESTDETLELIKELKDVATSLRASLDRTLKTTR